MTKTKITLALIVAACIAACTKDLVVKNIKDASITILAPANNTKTPLNAVTFWWELVDGAEKYNVQIVKPSFAAVQTLVADTNIVGNKYTRNLTPGNYQWRIKAINAGGSSAYTLYNLTIDTTSDLTNQLVVPISPLSGYLTGSKTLTFTWSGIPSANSYRIQILNGATLLGDATTSGTSYTYAVSTSTGGNFSWQVKAYNNSSVSQFNTPQTFTIDLRAPNPPALISPLSPSSATGTVDLKWTRNSSTILDVKYDSIYVATDSTFPDYAIVASARVNTTLINTAAFSPSLQPSASPSQYYFWKVRSIDSVGNKSIFSAWFKFHLNP